MFRGMLLVIAAWLVLGAGLSRAAERPNILFIIFDDLGWNHLGAYGCDWVETPNFDRVASEGVRFTNAFTSNPKCSPCRASILTGRNSWQLEEASCHFGVFPRKFAVYPELLQSAGYKIGLTGKGWGPGDFANTGFKHNPAGPGFNAAKTSPRTNGISRNDYAANFENFLKECAPDKPFCFWMGFLNRTVGTKRAPAFVSARNFRMSKCRPTCRTRRRYAVIWRTTPSKSNMPILTSAAPCPRSRPAGGWRIHS